MKLSRPLSDSEIKILNKIYSLARMIEDNFPSEAELADLVLLLHQFQFSDSSELRRLSETADHFHPKMDLKTFHDFLVPIERLLDRSVRDDDFIVTTDDRKDQQPKIPLSLALDNLRSAFNVGSLFRLADCLGISHLHLCGYTATPLQEQVQKTSLGAHEAVLWSHHDKIVDLIKNRKNQGTHIVAFETAEKSEPLEKMKITDSALFILGNERFGLNREVLQLCDQVLQIPSYGIKNSMNVSNAAAIASYEWRRRWMNS